MRKSRQGGDFLQQTTPFWQWPCRDGGESLFPCWREEREGCSRSLASVAPAGVSGLDGEVGSSVPRPLRFKSSYQVFSEVAQNSSGSSNSGPTSTAALRKMSSLLLHSKTPGLSVMPELVPASPCLSPLGCNEHKGQEHPCLLHVSSPIPRSPSTETPRETTSGQLLALI